MLQNSLFSSVNVKIDNASFYFIKEFFDTSTLEKVNSEIKRLALQKDTWKITYGEEYKNRRKFNCFNSPIFAEIIDYFNTSVMLNFFSFLVLSKVENVGMILWEDSEGYYLPMHVDNVSVKHSLQIYVGEQSNSTLGTSFGYTDDQPMFTLPFIPNSGYLAINPTELHHGVISKVPKDFKRYSLYFYIR